jgi:hypothetical protein
MYPFVTAFAADRDPIPDLTPLSWKSIADSIWYYEPPQLKEGSLLYKLIEDFAVTFLVRDSRDLGLKVRIKRDLAHLAAKFLENTRAIRERDVLINPGAVFRIKVHGGSAVVNFFEKETIDSIFTLINGRSGHQLGNYRTALTLSMKVSYPVPRAR